MGFPGPDNVGEFWQLENVAHFSEGVPLGGLRGVLVGVVEEAEGDS